MMSVLKTVLSVALASVISMHSWADSQSMAVYKQLDKDSDAYSLKATTVNKNLDKSRSKQQDIKKVQMPDSYNKRMAHYQKNQISKPSSYSMMKQEARATVNAFLAPFSGVK